jgi:hypothetical protein
MQEKNGHRVPIVVDQIELRYLIDLFPLVPPLSGTWLCSPMHLEPGRTAKGPIGFVFGPGMVEAHGSPYNWPKDSQGHPDIALEILDYVTDRTVTVPISYA